MKYIANLILWLTLAGLSYGQPRILVEPDSILFGNQTGAVNSTTLTNIGSEPLEVDSLRMIDWEYAWNLDIVFSDTTYQAGFSYGEPTFPTDLRLIEPQESIVVEFKYWDSCVVCKKGANQSGWAVDTLFVYSTDPARPVVTIPIDVRFYVGIESAKEEVAQARLDVFPNPVREFITFVFDSIEGGGHRLVIYDMLGRITYAEVVRGVPGQEIAVRLPKDTFASGPGLYGIVIQSAGKEISSSFVVID